ncbi:hypothetical protein LCGC14_0509130 [marine sediment metagenome]|uniref:Uncharacterized protein n=1 Tax=marine sediment metagenome TaxID=412755 RepID=A0A0F9SJZ3_9ZZZZ
MTEDYMIREMVECYNTQFDRIMSVKEASIISYIVMGLDNGVNQK